MAVDNPTNRLWWGVRFHLSNASLGRTHTPPSCPSRGPPSIFSPQEMLDTAIWFHHRPIGIQHIVGIERVDVNINAHIIHDTA